MYLVRFQYHFEASFLIESLNHSVAKISFMNTGLGWVNTGLGWVNETSYSVSAF